MNEILTITLVFILLTFLLVPFFITLAVFFPVRTAKTAEIAARTAGRSFVIGLVNFLFFFGFALLLFTLAERTDGLLRVILTFPALVITVVLSVALSVGLGAMTQLVGERVGAQGAWRKGLWGTLLLGLGCAFPLLGWFLLLPCSAWVGMGAFIISFFQRSVPERNG